jgi:hypothetical protein
MPGKGELLIIKAIGPDGTQERWVTTPRLRGYRTFGPRDLAAVFLSWNGVERAITEIRESEDCSEITFEVHAIPATQH